MKLAPFYKEFDRNTHTPPRLGLEWELVTDPAHIFQDSDKLWTEYRGTVRFTQGCKVYDGTLCRIEFQSVGS